MMAAAELPHIVTRPGKTERRTVTECTRCRVWVDTSPSWFGQALTEAFRADHQHPQPAPEETQP